MKIPKPLPWILAGVVAALAAVFLLAGFVVPSGHPDEQQARRDLLADHPTYSIERIFLDEREVVAVSYHIFYRVPGDSTLREEVRHYFHANGQWRLPHESKIR
jgi:hypothetical protein